MFVCLCRAVTDHQVEDAIAAGARDITDVAEACGAGSRCRGCWPSLQRLLDGEPLDHNVTGHAHSAA
jgi:bacterioferritin-associated ferredoxin